jgi:hypothetical protein
MREKELGCDVCWCWGLEGELAGDFLSASTCRIRGGRGIEDVEEEVPVFYTDHCDAVIAWPQ